MGFLSLSYILFFPVTALVYFLLPERGRNGWLLAASWFFYLCAGLESFPFLFGTAGVTYVMGLALEKRRKKGLLALTLGLFIGVLFLFKYLKFGVSLLVRGVGAAGLDWSPVVPQLLLPAGISFYFFAAMGYLIDVYRGKVRAERSFVKCALFLSFFPALLSGPIGRADRLLPQFGEPHRFRYDALREGLLRFLWGAFQKLVLADRLAAVVNTVFAAPGEFGTIQVMAAACAFSIQIYCDFSAYSDMAVGSARAMGFTLTENFRTPYFSRSIAEFWRRWHISLSTWFRDYLYIPLGGNRMGTVRKYLNLLIVFAVSGLWHGAAVSFLVWGLLNGIYQVLGGLTASLRTRVRARFGLREDGALTALWQMGCVFVLATLAWVFFKAGSVSAGLAVLRGMITGPAWVPPLYGMGMDRWEFLAAGVGFLLLLAVDAWSQKNDVTARVLAAPRWIRWCVYLGLLLVVVVFGSYGTGYDAQSFIYGQF
ncbi:MAG: MBOAT family O-acyltransferase [Pseudoflavonifractor sp.]|nr:MBOAT family O-acyltransferase [Pseudoflavonifractor sp.]